MQLPAIDQNIAGQWTELDKDTYAKLPYYLTKQTLIWRKSRPTWEQLLTTVPWEPNKGPEMVSVGWDGSPVDRQLAWPKDIEDIPDVDVSYVPQRTARARLYRKRFVSPNFNFLPSFRDFLTDVVDRYRDDINSRIKNYEESFYRTTILSKSGFVYLAGHGLVEAPLDVDTTAVKPIGWWQENLPKVSTHLSLQELFKALQAAQDYIGMTPYSGTEINNSWSAPMTDRYALIGGMEVWNQFINDPWVKENRPLNLNIITDGLRGDIFGAIRFRSEYNCMRVKVNDSFTPSFPPPQVLQVSGPDANRPRPNPDYSGAPYAIAWLLGGPSYKIVSVGPPPSIFAKKDVNVIMQMDWNGKIILTDNILVPVRDSGGNIVYETNVWGEYRRLQAQVVLGILPLNTFNVLPIVYRRKNVLDVVEV